MDGLGLWICLQNKFLVEAAQDRDDRTKQPDPDQIFFSMPLESLSSAGFAKAYLAKSGFQRT